MKFLIFLYACQDVMKKGLGLRPNNKLPIASPVYTLAYTDAPPPTSSSSSSFSISFPPSLLPSLSLLHNHQAWNREGCTLTISISSDRFRPGLEKATAGWSHKPHIVVCDVSSDTSLAECWTQIAEKHQGKLDLLTHSIAYATKPAMQNPLLEISRDDYLSAHSISSYSLIALSRHAAPLMDAAIEEKKTKRNMEKEVNSSNRSSATQKENDGKVVTSATTINNVLYSPPPSPPITGSIIALSYLGSQRTVPSYRVMGPAKASLEATARQLAVELGGRGIRVNVVSPGPIDTLAARGIQGFTVSRKRKVVEFERKIGVGEEREMCGRQLEECLILPDYTEDEER